MPRLTDAPGLDGPPDEYELPESLMPSPGEVLESMMLAGDADWLVTAICDALVSGDAVHLLEQCRRHIEPVRQAEAQRALDSMQDDGDNGEYDHE